MPVLLFTIVLSGMGFGLVLPAFLFFAENLGAEPFIATTIIGSYSLGQFIANPLWGRMSDRYGRKPVLLTSGVGMLAAYLVMAFAENLWMLGGARFLTGIMGANISVAMAYVTDVTPIEKRVQGMGLVGGAISLGFIIGPAFGGLLSGADADTATLLWPGLGAAALVAGTLTATLFLKESLPPEKRSGAAAVENQSSGLAAIRVVLRRPTVTRLIVIGLMIYFAAGCFEAIMPLWGEKRFGWGPREIGYWFTYLGVVIGFSQVYLVGRLASRFGETRLVMAGVAAYAVGLLWLTQIPSWPPMIIGLTLTGAGGAFAVTSMTSLVSRQAGEHERGLVLGTYNSGAWMGRFLGPAASGLMFQSMAVQAPLYIAALIMGLCFVTVALLRRHVRRAGAP